MSDSLSGDARTSAPGEPRPRPDEIHAQQFDYPASQDQLDPAPDSDLSNYRPADKLKGRVALITGGDSGIGRAVAIAYAMEGAHVAILNNTRMDDAAETQRLVEARGGRCLTIQADIRDYAACERAVAATIDEFGTLDILVNNAAYQMMQRDFDDVTLEQFDRTIRTNVYGTFHMTKAAMPHLGERSVIINTGSIIGLTGKEFLLDYTTSKGAVHTFTKSLALMLADRGIRVNAVVPGPVWTPNIPATMDPDMVEGYDSGNALGRAGQPEELAPAFVFLAAEDSSFVTGALFEVTGGQLHN
ncbi:SDR family oxidoreductase [Rubrivirga sp. IMCC43871]|uniref:SDR family oxidoreductase n=1 Tax=Rubrivirga sp. IMCC43871 TaxID=3391575 RepID=UPI00399037C0